MTDKDKVRENRLRRAADRQGLVLQKHRARDPRHFLFGTWQLIDARTGVIVAADWASGHGYGLSLDDIEKRLTR